MVIVKLIGGLGNQLFQYALGRAISHAHATTLKLDIGEFRTYTLRKYALGNFNILENFATAEDIDCVRRLKCSQDEHTHSDLPYYKRPFVKEQTFKFDPHILETGPNTYLEGYWQSVKYFTHIETVIRREFTVTHGMDAKNKEIAEQIVRVPSVSVHIRRGDYVSNRMTNQVHGTCPIEYYVRASTLIARMVNTPRFFVFSDDTEWVMHHLKLNSPITIIGHNGQDKDYEDLRLMSLCKHHIIANSSFSWWGVWLNNRPDKIVIAPQKWFNDPALCTDDLIPEGWIRL